MKRLLSLIVVLFVLVGSLASCSLIENIKFPWSKPSETDIQEAVKELDDIYGDANGSATSSDYELISQLKIDGTVFEITWTSNTDLIKIDLVDGYWYVTVPTDAKEQVNYTLTATLKTEGGQSAKIDFTRIIPVGGMGMITEPQIGGTYKLAVLHGAVNKILFFRGEANKPSTPWYLGSTDDVLSAVDVTLEGVDGVEGAFRLSFVFNGEKQYLRMYPRDGAGYENDGTIELTTECPEEYFTYDSEHNAIVWTHTNGSGSKSFLCCSGTYETIQASSYDKYIESEGTYIAFFYGAGGVEVELPEVQLPEIPENYTSVDVVNALYELKPGQTMEGPYYITGIVSSIKTAYDPAYGNVSFNILVEGALDKPVLIYRIKGEGLVDVVKPGDTVKVLVGLTNYNGTYETTAGGQIIELTPGTEADIPTVPGGDTPSTPAGTASLDLVGSANKVSADANKIVFSANGITYTCDKAESSSDLVLQETLAQRAYKGSTVKVEYKGMTKIVFVLDDYNNGQYIKGFDGMTVEGATITRDGSNVTVIFAAATDVFQSASLSSQVRIKSIEVYTGEVEAPEQGGTDKPTESYEAPVANQGYILYMTLPTKNVYFAGALDQGKYLATTADKTGAVAIYFEVVDGGYHIYFNDANGVKTYINAAGYKKSNGYLGCHFSTSTTAECVWTFDTTLGILEVKAELEGLDPDTFFPGSYDNNGNIYETMSLSGSYYKDQLSGGKQFPARLEKVAHTHEYTSSVTAPTCTEAGYTTYTCSCGHTYTEAGAAATGHTEAIDAAVSATCTETGLTEGKHCSVCKVVIVAQTVVPSTGHTDADKDFICDVESCKAELCTEHTAANAVKESEVKPTCTDDGYYVSVVKCSKCGDEISRETVVVKAPGHTEAIDEAVPATCTTDGKTEGKHCSVCNHVITAQTVVPATGHNYVDGVCSCGATNIVTLPETNGEWIIVTELKTGDQVIIGNIANGMLLSADKVSAESYYNKGVEYSHTNFANVTDAEIWTVTVNADGTYSFTSLTGEKLGMADNYSSFNSAGPNFSWALENQGNGLFYIKNTVRNLYIEWYADKSNWSGFGYPSNNPSLFELHFYVKGEGNQGGTVTPDPTPDPEIPTGTITSISEALNAPAGSAVELTGTVVEIYQGWNTQFNNISFYIADDNGTRILIFRTGTNVTVGDKVTVKGETVLFEQNNTIQVAQGATTTITEKHVCSTFTEADCLNAPACTVCGNTSGNALGHSYVNGACERCGAKQVSSSTTASATVADLITKYGWTSSTTKQSFNLDDNVSVKINGGSNTGKAYEGDHIRIYATDTPAGTITISVAEGYELVSVKITTAEGTYAFLYVDGTETDICNQTVSVSGSSVVLNSVKNGSNGKQVRVYAIEVVYAPAN